ncbi:MAG: YqaJ viral recombinase family protein [Ferruginibacter sp.]
MLDKRFITKTEMLTETWFVQRLAKFTSSNMHFLMGDRGLGDGGYSYIFEKVGELLKGMPSKKEITTDATEHGHFYEAENLRLFGEYMGLEFLVTQKLIVDPDRMLGSTPDALWVERESLDEKFYIVNTVEAKCPVSDSAYIKLWNCTTAEEVKKVEKKYYWQVLDQMRMCGSLKGYLSIYNPFYKAGGLNIVEFKKIDLTQDFKLLNQRIDMAIGVFNEQKTKMINSKFNFKK